VTSFEHADNCFLDSVFLCIGIAALFFFFSFLVVIISTGGAGYIILVASRNPTLSYVAVYLAAW